MPQLPVVWVDNPNSTPKLKLEFGEKYDPEPLSGGLPARAKVETAGGNVVARHDLPPISASLTA
jgi:hypothetical protein